MNTERAFGLISALCVVLAPATLAHGQTKTAAPQGIGQAWRPPASSEDATPPATVRDGFTYAVGGDLLGLWKPRLAIADPALDQVSKIFRNADAGFANLEGNLFDQKTFGGYPAAENGGFEQGGVGGGPLFAAASATDIKAMGISMVSTANNHALDWSAEGLIETIESLDTAGLAHAGTGLSRGDARSPVFVETARGRVAFISAASTYMPMAPAGPGASDPKSGQKAPRPGLSALRNRPITLVTSSEFDMLKAIAARQGNLPSQDGLDVVLDPNSQTYLDQTFRVSDHAGITYDVNKDDRTEILSAIKAGKKGADLAVFAIHAHETLSGGQEHLVPPETLAPADFLPPLFHDAVDAGADIVVTTGPHVLRGIEIYKGKAIFYGMGSLFFELGTGWPKEWYDSAVAVTEFRNGQVSKITVYPLVLGGPVDPPRDRTEQGIPQLATGVDAARILTALQQASAPYGTVIRIENGLGVIEPGDSAAKRPAGRR